MTQLIVYKPKKSSPARKTVKKTTTRKPVTKTSVRKPIKKATAVRRPVRKTTAVRRPVRKTTVRKSTAIKRVSRKPVRKVVVKRASTAVRHKVNLAGDKGLKPVRVRHYRKSLPGLRRSAKTGKIIGTVDKTSLPYFVKQNIRKVAKEMNYRSPDPEKWKKVFSQTVKMWKAKHGSKKTLRIKH